MSTRALKKAAIDETIAKTVYAHQQLQQKLAPSLSGDIEVK
jgi:hypothetical protein